jgi:hypothetical protein
LNGRRDAWRVAWSQGLENPVVGAGQGTFTRAWTEERRLAGLYILQPHSIALELFSELGVVGCALFAAAVGLVSVGAARSRERLLGAAALGAVVALLIQAAVDWTWSFPGLVVPALFVAGAAAGGRKSAPPNVVTIVIGAMALLAAVTAVAAPWLGQRALDDALRLELSDPAEAAKRNEVARSWNPWDPAALELGGRLSERRGAFDAAADAYHRAALLSPSPWLDYFRVARVAKASGDVSRRRSACALARASNPGEQRLYDALC